MPNNNYCPFCNKLIKPNTVNSKLFNEEYQTIICPECKRIIASKPISLANRIAELEKRIQILENLG